MSARLVAAVILLALGVSVFLPVPQSLKTYFDNGQSFYAIGEYELAIKEYTKIVNFRHKAVDVDQVKVKISEQLELPIREAAWYQLGNSNKKNGKYDTAIKAFRNVLKGAGVSERFKATVQYQIADTRFAQGEFEAAAEEYGSFVTLFPSSNLVDKAYFYQGWSFFKAKRYDDAVRTLTEMLSKYPTSSYAPDSRYRIATSYFEQGQYQEAIGEADELLRKYPESTSIANAEYIKGNSYEHLGQYDDAIPAYQRVIDLYDRMFELLRASFREGRNVDFERYEEIFESSFLRIAEIYRQQKGDYSRAYDTYVRAQETVREYDQKAKLQKLIGDNYLAWKRYDDALTAYRQVITNYPASPYPPQAQFYLGETLYYRGDYEAARAEYSKLLEDYPDTDTELKAQALYSGGWASEELQEYDRAIEIYSQAISSYPRSQAAPVCMLRIGRIAYNRGQYEKAEAQYRRIVEDYAERDMVADAYYNLGLALKEQGKRQEAIEAFDKVSENAGQSYVGAQMSVARLYAMEERAEEAEQVLLNLLKTVEGDPALEALTNYNIGQIYLSQLEEPRKAAKHYSIVIEQFPKSEYVNDCYYGRGQAYYRLLRFDDAISDYQYLLDRSLAPQMRDKTRLALALVYSALNRDRDAEGLLRLVADSTDRTLAQMARVQLVSLAERESPERAIGIYKDLLTQAQEDEERAIILARLASVYYKVEQYEQSLNMAKQLVAVSKKPEGIASGYYIAGNSYYRLGRYEEAIGEYRQVIEGYSGTVMAPGALFQVALAYSRMADDVKREDKAQEALAKEKLIQSSVQAFEEYYTRYADSREALPAYYYAAWGYYRMMAKDHWVKAAGVFQQLVRTYPRSQYAAESLFRAGESLFNEREWDKAYTLFDRVISEYSSFEWVDDAMYSKAWCLINANRKAEAVPIFGEIVQKFPHEQYGPMSQFTLGDYYYGEQDYENAKRAYETFLEMYPAHRRVVRAQLLLDNIAEISAYQLYSQGEKLFDEEKFKPAIAVFLQVREQYPESDSAVNALVNIGAAYQATEDYEKAAEFYTQLVRQYKDNAKYLAQVGFAEKQLAALREAKVISMR